MMKVLHPKIKIKVLGSGLAQPPGPDVTNLDLLARNPETAGKDPSLLQRLNDHILKTYGFEKRRFSHFPGTPLRPDEATSETWIAQAVSECFSRADAPDSSLEAFILGSTTPRRYTGSQATGVLGGRALEVPAFEIKAGCSTSLASLHLALALLAQGYTNVLVGCGETLSKVIHPEIRETWFGLADGAAALWIARDETARGPGAFEILSSVYSTDGRQVDLYTTPGTLPPNAAELEQGRYFLSGDSSALGAQALARYTAMIEALLPDPVRRSAIKVLIPHQVNLSLIQEVQARTGLGGRSHWIADQVGNMGGTSVLYAWVDALRTQSFQPGDEILLMSVGGGLSFAAQLWRAL